VTVGVGVTEGPGVGVTVGTGVAVQVGFGEIVGNGETCGKAGMVGIAGTVGTGRGLGMPLSAPANAAIPPIAMASTRLTVTRIVLRSLFILPHLRPDGSGLQ
jgi:hypothetical protein